MAHVNVLTCDAGRRHDGRSRTTHMADDPRWRELFAAIARLETAEEVEIFFRDLCTLAELEAMAHRWAGGAPAGAGASVPGDRAADGRVDDDGDAGRALAAPRRGRLPAGARPLSGLPEDRRPGQGPAARAVGVAARRRGPRARAAGRPRARVPVPQRAGRRPARARRRHPRVRAGRRRRLRHHRARPGARAGARCRRVAAARLRRRAGSRRPCRGVAGTSGSRIWRARRSRRSSRGSRAS